jgi:hypothetical protein
LTGSESSPLLLVCCVMSVVSTRTVEHTILSENRPADQIRLKPIKTEPFQPKKEPNRIKKNLTDPENKKGEGF